MSKRRRKRPSAPEVFPELHLSFSGIIEREVRTLNTFLVPRAGFEPATSGSPREEPAHAPGPGAQPRRPL